MTPGLGLDLPIGLLAAVLVVGHQRVEETRSRRKA